MKRFINIINLNEIKKKTIIIVDDKGEGVQLINELIGHLLAPVAGITALILALYLAWYINRFEVGDIKMKEIYDAIREGSKAYLKRQYKTISIISIILMLLLYIAFDLFGHKGIPFISFAFIIGAAVRL